MPEFANLNALDWVFIVALGLSTLLSLWRGFAREALSLAGWIAAFLIANLYGDQMASMLAGVINNITGRYVAAYAILFVLSLMAFGLLAAVVSKVIKATGLSLLDRLLGTVFGFTRGLILILVCMFVVRQLLPPGDLLWLHKSQLMPHLDVLAQWSQGLFANITYGPLPGISI